MPGETMANSAQQQQSLFTIEQIELLRRLRNSGIQKEQIVAAFESLDRMDRELGPVYTIPVTLAASMAALQGMQQMSAASVLNPNLAANMARQLAQAQQAAQAQATAQAQAHLALQQQAQQQVQQAAQQPVSQVTNPQAATQSRKRSSDTPVDELAGANGGGTPNPVSINGTTNNTPMLVGMEEVEESEEFKDFISKGNIHCCQEIRNFVIQYNIKQQQIAVLAGISQSYVSRYLKGDFHDMSERSRRNIIRWYITFKNNPGAIGPAAQAIMLTNSPVPVKKFITMDTSGEFVNYPKRERFVFRPSHLEVLERYFAEDSYPSQEKRDEIARACNASVEMQTGKQPGDRERVNPQVVSNWFANKRKEMKKVAREEGIDITGTPLSLRGGRGRPARFISDMMAAGTYNPTQLGAAQMMIGGLPQEEEDNEESMGMNGANALTHAQAAAQAAAMMVGGLPTTVPTNGNASTPDSSNNDNGSSNGDEDAERRQDEQQHLKMAVELAAVNQAIIALSGQTPITIKPESTTTDEAATSRNDPQEKRAAERRGSSPTAAGAVTSQQQNGIQASS